MSQCGLEVDGIDEDAVQRFLDNRLRQCKNASAGRRKHCNLRASLRHLLVLLRSKSVMAERSPELPRWSTAPLAWNPEHTNPPGGLAEYYKRNVVGGPGAFVIVAQDFESFGQAIINKLIGEVALASPPWRTARR
jgi:Protein of unknown function (DUF1194)